MDEDLCAALRDHDGGDELGELLVGAQAEVEVLRRDQMLAFVLANCSGDLEHLRGHVLEGRRHVDAGLA